MSEVLLHYTRAGKVEDIHRGDIVAVDTAGNIVDFVGDAHKKMFWRSAAKPFQALPFVKRGGLDKFSISSKELAILVSSHSGEPLEIHHTKRFTTLTDPNRAIDPEHLRPGSIFVVFSRIEVIRHGERLRRNGHTVAQIYGAMPPEVRRAEAQRFRSGDAQILVATDAIAMGLNLPAHTVVLGEGSKYNGQEMVPLAPALIRQIAGRAGRFWRHRRSDGCSGDGSAFPAAFLLQGQTNLDGYTDGYQKTQNFGRRRGDSWRGRGGRRHSGRRQKNY